MSHYKVYVMTKEEPDEFLIGKLMERYNENRSVPRYIRKTKEELLEEINETIDRFLSKYQAYAESGEADAWGKRYFENTYKKYLDNLENEEKLIEIWAEENDVKKLSELEEDELDKSAIDEFYNYTSTYNPESKWDWYCEGGSFGRNYGIITNKKYKELGEDWKDCEEAEEYVEVTCCQLKDVRLYDDSPSLVEEATDFWNGYVLGQDPEYKDLYRREYYLEKYGTLENYLEHISFCRPYAFVDPEGEWHAPGNVGWFGVSDDTGESLNAFCKEYADYVYDHPDYYVTSLDCHI